MGRSGGDGSERGGEMPSFWGGGSKGDALHVKNTSRGQV
jgi:hypothetical protein